MQCRCRPILFQNDSTIYPCTGKSVSEAFILESVNPRYDKRLFIEFQENTSWQHVVYKNCFFCFWFDIQNNICTQHVLPLYFSGNSMNNFSSYCGLTDSRIRGSDTDLPKESHGGNYFFQNNLEQNLEFSKFLRETLKPCFFTFFAST